MGGDGHVKLTTSKQVDVVNIPLQEIPNTWKKIQVPVSVVNTTAVRLEIKAKNLVLNYLSLCAPYQDTTGCRTNVAADAVWSSPVQISSRKRVSFSIKNSISASVPTKPGRNYRIRMRCSEKPKIKINDVDIEFKNSFGYFSANSDSTKLTLSPSTECQMVSISLSDCGHSRCSDIIRAKRSFDL